MTAVTIERKIKKIRSVGRRSGSGTVMVLPETLENLTSGILETRKNYYDEISLDLIDVC